MQKLFGQCPNASSMYLRRASLTTGFNSGVNICPNKGLTIQDLDFGTLGGIKKLVFFTFRQKGGGGSRPILKILIRKYSDFLTKGGGLSPNPKGFYQKNCDFLT